MNAALKHQVQIRRLCLARDLVLCVTIRTRIHRLSTPTSAAVVGGGAVAREAAPFQFFHALMFEARSLRVLLLTLVPDLCLHIVGTLDFRTSLALLR